MVDPPRENFTINTSTFFICEKHWPLDSQMIKATGGSTRPASPPSIFNVPLPCLSTSKSAPRHPKLEDRQLAFFLKKDSISFFADFSPDKVLL